MHSKSLQAEHPTYGTLKDKTVYRVPTVATYRDMLNPTTQTSLSIERNTKRGDSHSTFRYFIHYRLVLDQYTKPIEEFDNVKGLPTVFTDALKGKSNRLFNCDAHQLIRHLTL